jgi:hypothetical protein
MKKYFVLIGAAILVMALASPGMTQAPTFPVPNMNVQMPVTAQTEFKTWGHLEIQTVWERKPDFNTGAAWSLQPSQGYAFSPPPGSPWLAATASGLPVRTNPNQDMTYRHIAERFRMNFQYGDAKTVRAVLGFEADSQDWGEPGAVGNLSPGTYGNAAAYNPITGANPYTQGSNHFGVYRSDMVQLEVTWAFLEFMVPNSPVQISAGVQRFMVGGRMWMQNDAPGVKVRANFAPHLLEGFWWRQKDTARNTYGVNDMYGLIYELNQKDFNFYAWGAFNNDLSGGATTLSTAVPISVNFQSNQPWWLAAGGGYRPGNWNLSGQFIYNGGTFKPVTGSNLTYDSWALELLAKYRIGPGMFVGLEYFYASGNEADKRDKINAYTYPAASESNAIFGNDRTVFFWRNGAQFGYYHERNLSFLGMWYGRANFEYSPTSWIRCNLNYLYIGDNSSGTPGSLPGAPTAAKVVNSAAGAYQGADRKHVGQELNLITSFNIYKNFMYHVGLAVFFPGDVYDLPYKSADTAYAVNSKLVYAF